MTGDIFLAAHGCWLPSAVDTADQVRTGLLSQKWMNRNGHTSVCVSTSESGPEMARRAVEIALARGGLSGVDLDLLAYANTSYQGHDLWPPASYLQRVAAAGDRCLAVEVRQMSNGCLAALEIAAGYLLGRDLRYALIATGDRFCPPGFDRWNSDPGVFYADGGTALVVSRVGGYARLRSLVTVADPELERMHRGDDRFSVAPFTVRQPVDMAICLKAFTARVGTQFVLDRINAGQREAVSRALDAADLKLTDIDRFVLPNFGARRLLHTFYRPFGIDPAQTTWEWGRRVGHLGAGDQIAGLAHLVDAGLVGPGDLVLLAGIAAGFSWSCAVVEICARPAWAVPTRSSAGVGTAADGG